MEDRNRSMLEKCAPYGLLLLTILILFTSLGSFPLQMQWEPNYGQVVREMAYGEGDPITPTCKVGSDEGAAPGTFWSKPIMIFWMAYPFYKILGDTEWAARLPIAMTGAFVVMMVFWQMGRIFGRRTGLLAGILLLTCPTYFLISRAFMVDLPFVGFMLVAILFLLMGEKEGRRRWYDLFYVFMGLSSLAKGLTPLILVGGSIFFYCLITMRWRLLLRMNLLRGLIIYFVVAAPWYLYMTAKYGFAYPKKFFWDHHVERSLGKLDKPDETFQMFVLYFSCGILPWITFLPQAITTMIPWRKKEADEGRPELFLLISFTVIFTFFSVISTKFAHYIFPAVAMVTLLLAVYINRLFEQSEKGMLNRMTFFVGLLVLLIVAPDLLDQKNYRTLFYFITTERLQDWHPNVADPTYFFSIVFILWGAILAVAMLTRRFNRWLFGGLVVLAVAYAFYINMSMIPKLTEMFSARSMVQTYLSLRSSPDEPLGEFTQTWKSRSIKYYMPFDELKNKYQYRRYRITNKLPSVKRFYKRYKGKRVFIIIEQKQKHFNRINALWQEVSGGQKLIKIADDAVRGEPYRPEFWLVSNRDNHGRSQRVDKKQQAMEIKKFVRKEAFTPGKSLPVMFEDEIKLLGYEPLPEKHIAGEELEITLYFETVKKPTKDYEIFVHAERQKLFRLRGDHIPVAGKYPVRKWEVGDYIKDVYTIDVPPHTKPGELEVFIGLYKGNHRARVSDVIQRDSEGRLLVGKTEIVAP